MYRTRLLIWGIFDLATVVDHFAVSLPDRSALAVVSSVVPDDFSVVPAPGALHGHPEVASALVEPGRGEDS